MTLKTFLGGSISALAISLIGLPAIAADKTKIKTKKDNIECTVTIEDGKPSVVKIVNGKTVKAAMDDEECNINVHKISGRGGMRMMKMGGSPGEGHRLIKIIEMEGGPDIEKRFFMKNMREFPSMGGDSKSMTMFFNDDGDAHGGDHPMRWMGKGGPGLHMRSGNDFQFMMMDGSHEDLDLNDDGKVTEAEARSARDAKLKTYDANGDGRLSLTEYQNLWMEKRHAQMVDAFQSLDEDGDAQITGEEFSASAIKGAKMHARIEKMLEEHISKAKIEKSKSKKKRK